MNATKLDKELRAAGLAIHGCSSDGRVDFADGTSWRPGDPADTPERATAAKVVAAHNPNPSYDELRQWEYPSVDELVFALWERVIELRPELSNVLQAKREAIKVKYPKP